MSAGDIGQRPSVPHAMARPRTDRARTLPSDEAETVRESFSTDPAIAELLALVREPSGVSIETLLKVLALSSRQAVIAAKQDDKLRVDVGVGQITEKLDSMIASRTLAAKVHRKLLAAVYAGGWAAAFVFGGWMVLSGRAHDNAAATIVAPAVAAEAKVLTLEERITQTEKRHDDTEQTLSDLRASVERLNGAVVALAGKLEEPARVEVRKP